MNFRDAPAVKSGEVHGYIDDPCERYVEGMKVIIGAAELRAYLANWPFLAQDAIKQAARLKDKDVLDMQKNRNVDSEGERVAKRYGCILIPERMLILTQISDQFKAPAGAVYIRLWETGEHDRLMALGGGALRRK